MRIKLLYLLFKCYLKHLIEYPLFTFENLSIYEFKDYVWCSVKVKVKVKRKVKVKVKVKVRVVEYIGEV